MQTKIQNNLFLRVDYNYSFQNKSGNLPKEPQFFIIGVLPVFIEYKDGTGERASINKHLAVMRDPWLRSIHGQRVGDGLGTGKYKKEIGKIAEKLEKAFKKILDTKSFNKKAIKDIYIINTEKNATGIGNKN